MNDLSPTRLWLMRAAFGLLALVILLFHLLPLDTLPASWAGPDLILAFAMAWSLRRPEYVTAPLLAGVFLLADLLLQRPPGLWAVLALMGCENLKSRIRPLRDAGFGAEWIAVSLIVVAITAFNRLILAMTLAPVPPLALSVFELMATLLVYPLVVAVTHFGFGVRKTAPGDLDALGQRV
ncbi:MAG: rod shape-determining protein MreD [Pseudomonadota bacterium]